MVNPRLAARCACAQVHLYGFGNGSCGDACYHYYDCGPTAGSSGVKQSLFLTKASASGGFHNFSAQASVLQRMAREGLFTPHWGKCERNLGGPFPPEYANTPERAARGRGRKRGGRGRGRGKGGGGKAKGKGGGKSRGAQLIG